MERKIDVPKISLDILEILKQNPDGLNIYEIRNKLNNGDVQQHMDRRVRQLDQFFIIDRVRSGRFVKYVYRGERKADEWVYRSIPKDTRAKILNDSKGICSMCGRSIKEDGVKITVDHKIPLSVGGLNSEDNLWAICSDCNEGKGNSFVSIPELIPMVNKIHNMDIKELLRQLPDGSVDCVYSDIDYNVGVKYSGKSYTKAFKDYLAEYITLASESIRVLSPTGSAFFINYPKNNAHLWVHYLENACYDVQEYIWIYRTNVGHSRRRFTTAHRSILHCMKSPNSKFYKDNVSEPYVNQNDKRIRQRMKAGSKGRSPYSWIYADMVKNVTKWSKNVDHPCVIPDKVSSTLIASVTKPHDVVLVLFAGSGSEINVCRALNRNWIAADLDHSYCDQINKRLDNYILTFEENDDGDNSKILQRQNY